MLQPHADIKSRDVCTTTVCCTLFNILLIVAIKVSLGKITLRSDLWALNPWKFSTLKNLGYAVVNYFQGLDILILSANVFFLFKLWQLPSKFSHYNTIISIIASNGDIPGFIIELLLFDGPPITVTESKACQHIPLSTWCFPLLLLEQLPITVTLVPWPRYWPYKIQRIWY